MNPPKDGAGEKLERDEDETPVGPSSAERTGHSGFDARRASEGTAGVLAIFAALVIPVLFEAASPELKTAGPESTSQLPSGWLFVAIVLLCAAFLGLAGASIGLLGLAGDRGRKPAQIASAMALYAQATCGFVGLLAAVQVYCSVNIHAVVVVLVFVVAGVAALGCMTVASLLVDSSSALTKKEKSGAWIRYSVAGKQHSDKHHSGKHHFIVITIIAGVVLVGVTAVKVAAHISPGYEYAGYPAGLVISCAVVFLPFSVIRSLPRKPLKKPRPIKRWEAYLFGLVPALATSLLIIGLPLN